MELQYIDVIEKKVDKKYVSIVIPSLNEELTVGEFVEWCKQGLKDAGVDGEILIMDSSSDRTAEIAELHGARVIKVPKRGLGQAYIDAMPYINGEYVLMGDCDCTYDFRHIKPFIEKLDEGYDFVMGTRMKGYIEPKAMPPLHQYFGTPLTTFIFNIIYGTGFSDIHCGMRAMTFEALKRINIESSSWEYASEMILKAAKLNLKTSEVPIKFYKDPEGRVSHHKRQGWFSPWYAGWINLKVMFLYSPEFFLKLPGLIAMICGLILVCGLANGPITIGKVGFSLYWLFLGSSLTILGYSTLQMAIISTVFYNFNLVESNIYKRIFSYNKGVLAGIFITLAGILISIDFLVYYIKSGLRLYQISHPAIIGLLLLVLGFQTFTFTLVFQMIVNKQEIYRKREVYKNEK